MTFRHCLTHTAAGRLLLIPFRFFLVALPYGLRQFAAMLRWVFTSKEHYNHTYHLTELNLQYLASYIAVISGHKVGEIQSYIRELEKDEALRALLRERTLASPDRHNSDVEPRYGRRLGWYALVRATTGSMKRNAGVFSSIFCFCSTSTRNSRVAPSYCVVTCSSGVPGR